MYSIKSNAVLYDDIRSKFIKIIISFLLTLTHIFNDIIATNIYPSACKIAQIIPVAKKSTLLEPDDYRPMYKHIVIAFQRIRKSA